MLSIAIINNHLPVPNAFKALKIEKRQSIDVHSLPSRCLNSIMSAQRRAWVESERSLAAISPSLPPSNIPLPPSPEKQASPLNTTAVAPGRGGLLNSSTVCFLPLLVLPALGSHLRECANYLRRAKDYTTYP